MSITVVKNYKITATGRASVSLVQLDTIIGGWAGTGGN